MERVDLPPILRERGEFALEKIDDLRQRLLDAGVNELIGSTTSVYVTGSLARAEASSHSDLDVFMFSEVDDKDSERLLLGRLELIKLQSTLMAVASARTIEYACG